MHKHLQSTNKTIIQNLKRVKQQLQIERFEAALYDWPG